MVTTKDLYKVIFKTTRKCCYYILKKTKLMAEKLILNQARAKFTPIWLGYTCFLTWSRHSQAHPGTLPHYFIIEILSRNKNMQLFTCALRNRYFNKFIKKYLCRSQVLIYNHFHNIWDFLMFYQVFLSLQVKLCAIITYKHGI